MKFSRKLLWSSVVASLMTPIAVNAASNTYNSSTGLLTLPVVYVPSGNGEFQRYSAILQQLPATNPNIV